MPKPPYYAVIFTSKLKETNQNTYANMAEKMLTLASQQKGFLGEESARETIGITVSYWKDLNSIQQWKENSEHLKAQVLGRNEWYKNYTVRIAKVEKEYCFES